MLPKLAYLEEGNLGRRSREKGRLQVDDKVTMSGDLTHVTSTKSREGTSRLRGCYICTCSWLSEDQMGVEGKNGHQILVSRGPPPSTHYFKNDDALPKAVTRLTCVSLASTAESPASQPLRAALAFPLATRVPP